MEGESELARKEESSVSWSTKEMYPVRRMGGVCRVNEESSGGISRIEVEKDE